jgi:hypothetical protein
VYPLWANTWLARCTKCRNVTVLIEDRNRDVILKAGQRERADGNLGLVARQRGHFERAAALYKQSLALGQALADKRLIAWATAGLGDVARKQGARVHQSRSGLARLQPQHGQGRQRERERVGVAILWRRLGHDAARVAHT